MGAVYVLHNCEFPSLVKVGMTSGSAEDRAAQLFSTGVPTPFVVLFSQPSNNPRQLERAVHDALAEFRHNDRREFFRVAPRRAIETLIAEAGDDLPLMHPTAEKDITDVLLSRWGAALAPDLKYARLKRAEFETTLILGFANSLGSRVSRTDLEVIWDDDAPMFGANVDVSEAAALFLELDAVTLIMTTELFDAAVAGAIDDVRQQKVPTERIDELVHNLAADKLSITRAQLADEVRRLAGSSRWGSVTPDDGVSEADRLK